MFDVSLIWEVRREGTGGRERKETERRNGLATHAAMAISIEIVVNRSIVTKIMIDCHTAANLLA
jgi:hypothetical protein